MSPPAEARAVGGGLVGGTPEGPSPSATPRTNALRTLRAVHAERGRLQLRRIEVRVQLDERRRVVAALEAGAPATAQGPAETVIFESAARAVAELTIEARAIDQRLYRIEREIRAAQSRAITAVLRHEVVT